MVMFRGGGAGGVGVAFGEGAVCGRTTMNGPVLAAMVLPAESFMSRQMLYVTGVGSTKLNVGEVAPCTLTLIMRLSSIAGNGKYGLSSMY